MSSYFYFEGTGYSNSVLKTLRQLVDSVPRDADDEDGDEDLPSVLPLMELTEEEKSSKYGLHSSVGYNCPLGKQLEAFHLWCRIPINTDRGNGAALSERTTETEVGNIRFHTFPHRLNPLFEPSNRACNLIPLTC